MVDKKRGILVVLIILLVVLTENAFGGTIGDSLFTGIFVNIADDDDCNGDHDVTEVLTGASKSKGDCSWNWDIPLEGGCIALFREDDTGNGAWGLGVSCLWGSCDVDDDDCAKKYADSGKIIQAYTYDGLGFGSSDACSEQPVRINAPETYICNENYFWQKCDIETLQGTIAWNKNGAVYNCTSEESSPDVPLWQPLSGTDIDHDGYTTPTDCQDNPGASGLTPKDRCPQPDETGTVDCTSLESAKCAICINPGAIEICGDGIDNDCNKETSDECNKNQPPT